MAKRQHHIGLGDEHLSGNGGLGRYVLLPGDPSRARKIADSFADLSTIETPRRLDAHLGVLEGVDGAPIDVLAIPSGIGAPAVEVVLHELIECGARRFVRVGSCGTLTPEITPGQVIIATGAVRDESASQDYAPIEYPAVAHRLAMEAMVRGAEAVGLSEHTFCGLCHSKSSLYAREFGRGPRGEANLEYNQWLKRCGVIASEMEASMLFVMASARTSTPIPVARRPSIDECQAVAVLAVFGGDDSHMEIDEEQKQLAERRAIETAIEGVRQWALSDQAAL